MYEKKIIEDIKNKNMNSNISILGGICNSQILIDDSIEDFCSKNKKDPISNLFLKD